MPLKYRFTLALVLSLLGTNGHAAYGEKLQPQKKNAAVKSGCKGRRMLSPWFICENDKQSIQELKPLADRVDSISIFGEAGPEFIHYCHQNDIEAYYAVSGGGKEFDTAAHRQATIAGYLEKCRKHGYDGIDLDFEHLEPELVDAYTRFLHELSQALHQNGKKLSICVGFYPAMVQEGQFEFFYDPRVIGQTCDMVRVMCYDMYYAPGKGRKDLRDRQDCQGIGPTSTAPWARQALQFWLQSVPREKLIMGLPAYGNDYDMTPNGKGRQIEAPQPPSPGAQVFDKVWLPYERVHLYRYFDDQDHLHVFYASDAKSTAAHLETVEELNLGGISFWTFQSVTDDTWKAVRKWIKD